MFSFVFFLILTFLFVVSCVFYFNFNSSSDRVVVSVNFQVSKFGVSGSTASELIDSLSFWGGGHWAYVSYRMNPDIKLDFDNGVCVVKRIFLNVDMMRREPKISFFSFPPACLVKNFDEMKKNLLIHEQGHVDITNRHLESLKSYLLSMDGDSSCSILSSKIDDVISSHMVALNKEQVKYDIDTQHGVGQGVVLNDCEHD